MLVVELKTYARLEGGPSLGIGAVAFVAADVADALAEAARRWPDVPSGCFAVLWDEHRLQLWQAEAKVA